MAAKSIYETLTITAEIDMGYSTINFTLATGHQRGFTRHLLIGCSMRAGIETAK